MLPLLIFLLGLARAEDPATTLQAITAERHPCVDRLPALDARLASQPDDLAAQLEQALCLHAVGRYDNAVEALDGALKGRPLGPLLKQQPQAEEAAVVRVVLLAWKQRPAEAASALGELRAALGDQPGTFRAATMVQGAGGDVAGAWSKAESGWKRWPEHPHMHALVGELTAREPDRAPAWAREILGRTSAAVARYNRAVAALTGSRFSACTDIVEEALSKAADAEEERRLRILGYKCATFAGRLPEANQHMLKLRDLKLLDGQAVLAHADLLVQIGRIDDALRLLKLAPLDALGERRDTRIIRLSLDQKDLETALVAARRGMASPESRATLGLVLHQAGRDAEAREVLTPACGQLTDRAKADCEGLLKRLR